MWIWDFGTISCKFKGLSELQDRSPGGTRVRPGVFRPWEEGRG